MSDLAKRMSLIKPSPTITVTDKANKLKSEGKKVCVLAAGEPDFDTPDRSVYLFAKYYSFYKNIFGIRFWLKLNLVNLHAISLFI